MRKITKGRVNMKVWDIGGQPRFRSMWERYCRGVNAIVFVLDSADLAKIDEARKLLHDLMQRPSLQDTALLVLGNKNDLDQSLSAADLTSQMQLQVRLQVLPLLCCSIAAGSCLCLPVPAQVTKQAKRSSDTMFTLILIHHSRMRSYPHKGALKLQSLLRGCRSSRAVNLLSIASHARSKQTFRTFWTG